MEWVSFPTMRGTSAQDDFRPAPSVSRFETSLATGRPLPPEEGDLVARLFGIPPEDACVRTLLLHHLPSPDGNGAARAA
eukprot:349711-Prymnesium_polylepis.2